MVSGDELFAVKFENFVEELCPQRFPALFPDFGFFREKYECFRIDDLVTPWHDALLIAEIITRNQLNKPGALNNYFGNYISIVMCSIL